MAPPCDPNCQNSVLDPGEECDDGNSIDGDGCDHACALEPCWQFDSFVGLVFPLPPGTSCDAQDGIACTVNGLCDGAGHCVETPTASLCDDDGNPCTNEVCDPLAGCVHTPGVRLDCRPAASSTLQVKTRSDDRDKLTWTWTRGQSTSQADFADPQVNASYRFCAFAGAANATVATATVPPDASRWQPTAKGFSYTDPAAAAAGITRVKLIASDTDRARIGLKGKGASLAIATPPVDLPITAQLTNEQSNVCWSATYDAADIRRNEARTLNAKATAP